MENKSAYAHLAKWFEYLNDDCGYENWSQYLIDKLRAYPLSVGLDIGCGGGWFTRAFARQGYLMTGMDVSAEMLNAAQAAALKAGIKGEYLLGDIAKMKLPRRFDFATAINDCINYIPKDKLLPALKNIHGALKKGGVFLFDVSSPCKFTRKVANTVSVDDRDEVTSLAFNRMDGDKVTLDVTVFEREPSGKYVRLDETHVQYVYTEEELLTALQTAGFTPVWVEGHLGEDKNVSDRIVILAQK